MTLLALIPARGGSKGIPRKNIRLFCGKPLLYWTIDAALASVCVDHVVVSTEDPEIAQLAKDGGAEVPFLRPPELATDVASGIAPVLHALDQFPNVTDVLLLQPTSPLRTSSDIEAIVALRQQAKSESAVSLTNNTKHPAWMYHLNDFQQLKSVMQVDADDCRQQLPTVYVLNGAMYLATRSMLVRSRSFIDQWTVGYLMPADRSVDIDTPYDWKWAEFLMSCPTGDNSVLE